LKQKQSSSPEVELNFNQCLLLLRGLLEGVRRTRPLSIGITTVSGKALTIDSSSKELVAEGTASGKKALSIVTNERTLSAVLTGNLNPKTRDPKHVWIQGGDRQQWSALIETVAARQGVVR